jgi:hypothetical protein
MSGRNRARSDPGVWQRVGRPLALLAGFLPAVLGSAGALAGSCPRDDSPPDRVLSRLPLYDAGRAAPIRTWSRGDPSASADFAFTAGGAGEDARALRVSYRLDPTRHAQAGARIKLNGLDASAYDHLEFRVRGDPAAGFARSFEVGFQRPRPDRPDMMENASYVVADVSDQWRYVRVPLNLMTGIRTWTGLDEFVLTFDARRNQAASGAIYVDDLALISTGQPGPSAFAPVPMPKKEAWEQAQGGRDAARAKLPGRLRGWPGSLTVAAPEAADDRAFLMQVAADTWRGLSALVDREHGLPIDQVGFSDQTVDPARARVGDYTSPSTVGIWLMAVTAATELGLLDRPQAIATLETTLATLGELDRYRGFFYNYYDTTSLERSSNFVSSIDSGWLTAGLMVLRSAFPELADRASGLIEDTDYGQLYDAVEGLMSHGYYASVDCPSEYHYGLLYTEARVLSLIAIGKGDVPEAHWFRLLRTFAPEERWQTQTPKGRVAKQIHGETFQGGWYERDGYRYVPSWGGSMFEALMPTLVVDETAYAPKSLGRNGEVHALLQRRFALDELGYPVWGLSPSATVTSDGYGEFGVSYLGTLGYPAGVITPHASALALAVTPQAAIANLRELARRYPIYGEFGFYDAVDPTSGKVGYRYLTLDQGMLFLALGNHLADHAVQRAFAADPIAARVLPMLAEEHFFDG